MSSETNWDHVRRIQEADAAIPSSPEDGPYDPNDDAAVEAYWEEGRRLGLVSFGYEKHAVAGEPGKRSSAVL